MPHGVAAVVVAFEHLGNDVVLLLLLAVPIFESHPYCFKPTSLLFASFYAKVFNKVERSLI